MSKVKTYNLYGIEDLVEIPNGNYRMLESNLFPFVRCSNKEIGVKTAQEVSEFINAKMDEPRFGFVFVKDDGNKVTWYDDQPYNMEITFKRIKQ